MRICKLGEEILRQKCEPVKPEEINDEFRGIIEEMFQTMVSADGVGLAGPQVGVEQRLFVVEIPQDQNIKMSQIERKTIQQQGAKPDLSGCIFDAAGVKSAFALLSAKVTKPAPYPALI